MDSLDPSVLLLGVTCLGFFVAWLVGRKVESLEGAFDSLPAALVAMGALCMAPVFFYMGWQQFEAKSRLQRENLPVCAALGHAVGAQGGRAPRGIWRFEALDDAQSILAYYGAAAVQSGWKLEKRSNGLRLDKSGAHFAIWAERTGDKEQIIIQKTP
jgi:hypothetical protein